MNIEKIVSIAGLSIMMIAFAVIISKDKTTIEKAVIMLLPFIGGLIGFLIGGEVKPNKY